MILSELILLERVEGMMQVFDSGVLDHFLTLPIEKESTDMSSRKGSIPIERLYGFLEFLNVYTSLGGRSFIGFLPRSIEESNIFQRDTDHFFYHTPFQYGVHHLLAHTTAQHRRPRTRRL